MTIEIARACSYTPNNNNNNNNDNNNNDNNIFLNL